MLWLIGGLDPTAGAGILRDATTASIAAPELPIRTCVTAFTRQGHGRPAQAEAVSPATLHEQLRDQPTPTAVKIGLVPAAIAPAVVELLAGFEGPIVVDPVLRASDGGSLGASPSAHAALLARASVVTPNVIEARALGASGGTAIELARSTLEVVGGRAVLLKGGHADPSRDVVDVLASRTMGERVFVRPRRGGPDPRGTGCALATAIACGLAQGWDLDIAVARAIAWLDEARTRARPVGTVYHLPSGGPALASG